MKIPWAVVVLFATTILSAKPVNDGSHGGLIWNKSRPTGYGAVPGYRPPALGHNWNLIECSAWGGRPMTPFGGYQIGWRPLLADIGQWASADAAGHGASDNLMTFSNCDPINLTDVDGLCSGSTFSLANSD